MSMLKGPFNFLCKMPKIGTIKKQEQPNTLPYFNYITFKPVLPEAE